MMARSRAEERDHLIAELGILVAPLRRLAFRDDDVRTLAQYERARFKTDYVNFCGHVHKLGRVGQHQLEYECRRIGNAVWDFDNVFTRLTGDGDRNKTRTIFENLMVEALLAIRSLPIDDPDTILPAESPFATYLRLRAMCAQAVRRVQLFDPYFDVEVFHRYVPDVPATAELALVTKAEIIDVAGNPRLSTARRDRIIAASQLVAQERPAVYRFLVTTAQHDRHLRIDDAIFHVGGSVKDAASSAPYTIAKLDPTQSNHAFLDSIISGATPWWAPGMQTHRKV